MGFPCLRLALAGSAILAASATLVMPAMAAQSEPQALPSVEGYLCTFAGKCDSQASDEIVTRDAPETKGFRLARPSGDTPAASHASAPVSAIAAPRAFTPPPRATKRAYREGADQLNAREAARLNGLVRPASSGVQSQNGQPGAGRRADLMIGFELNSARISREGLASAGVFAQSLLRPELAGKRFAIEGHTDLRGGRALNMALSARRAQAVADFLASRGVERSRLVARGLGPDVPLAGRRATAPENRRVEAELLP